MNWPIYVPTKGRAGAVSEEVLSLSPTLVCEEHEAWKYRQAYGTRDGVSIRAFGEKDRGVSHARNRAKEMATGDLSTQETHGGERREPGWAWFLDDDLFHFFRRPSAAREEPARVSACVALGRVEAAVRKAEETSPHGERLAMAGLPVYWRADSLDGRHYWNEYCYCAVALHVGRLADIWYDTRFRLKEDTDFVLRVLSGGFCTVRVHEVAFRMPTCGSEPGGLWSVYQEEDEQRRAAELLRDTWPELMTLGKTGVHPTIDWGRFALEGEAPGAADHAPSPAPKKAKKPARPVVGLRTRRG